MDLWEESNETDPSKYTDLKLKSKFTPYLGNYRNIDLFLETMKNEIDKIDNRSLDFHPNMNLSSREQVALKSLRNNTEIILKPADKGGNIVMMDITDYVTMVLKVLEDENTYKILKSDPTNDFLIKYREILDRGRSRGLLSGDEYAFIFNCHPRIATFYCLPKVHKSMTLPPGRPIVSGIDNLTQNCSIYIDKILRPFVEKLPSYLQDTKQTLALLANLE
ncbi:Hypothetical predicted protein, partial [Pelobates cultripes]